MLGHQSPETAYIYTKLAVEDLREVALSLGEVLP
jgi:site-specific recombinase XerD